MNGRALALTPRDRSLLFEVQRCGVLTRDQILRLKLFSSKTRVNERLRRLTAAGYLTTRPQPLLAGGPRFVYLPGRLLTPSTNRKRLLESSDLFLSHELGLVDIRLAFEHHTTVTRWSPASELTPLSLGFAPDAFLSYEAGGLAFCAFIEYDRGTETLGRIQRKSRAYVDLAFSGRFAKTFGRTFFHALFVTDTPGRLATMSEAIARVTDRVVRLTTLPELLASGPVAAVWRRPGSTRFESLTTS